MLLARCSSGSWFMPHQVGRCRRLVYLFVKPDSCRLDQDISKIEKRGSLDVSLMKTSDAMGPRVPTRLRREGRIVTEFEIQTH